MRKIDAQQQSIDMPSGDVQPVSQGAQSSPTGGSLYSIPRFIRNVSNMTVAMYFQEEGLDPKLVVLRPGEFVDLSTKVADLTTISKNLDLRNYLRAGLVQILSEEEYLKLAAMNSPESNEPDSSVNPFTAVVKDNYVTFDYKQNESGAPSGVSNVVIAKVNMVKQYLETGEIEGTITPAEFAVWMEQANLTPNDIEYIRAEIGKNPLIAETVKKLSRGA